MTVIHELKTWPQYWEAVRRGEKTFEVRRDDRGFQKGDLLVLQKFDPDKQGYVTAAGTISRHKGSAVEIEREISWILTGGQFGIEPGFVVMGLAALSISHTHNNQAVNGG